MLDPRPFFSVLAVLLGLGIALQLGLGLWMALATMAGLGLTWTYTGFVTYRSLSGLAPLRLESWDRTGQEAPLAVREEWASVAEALEANGFMPVGAVRAEHADHIVFSMAWTAPDYMFHVSSAMMSGRAPKADRFQRLLAAATWLRDGTSVETVVGARCDPMGGLGGFSVVHLPAETVPEQLVTAHRAHMARAIPRVGGEDVLLPSSRELVEFSGIGYDRFREMLEAAGHVRATQGAECRPTLKGWAVWTVGNLWPLSALRRAASRVNLLRVVAALAGLAGVVVATGVPGALGVMSWALLGMIAVAAVRGRRRRSMGVKEIVIGGGAGVAALLMLIWPLLLPTPEFPIPGPNRDLIFVMVVTGLYIGAASVLFWAWRG